MSLAKVMSRLLTYFHPILHSKVQIKRWTHNNQGKNKMLIFKIKQYQCQQTAQFTKKFLFKSFNLKDHAANYY